MESYQVVDSKRKKLRDLKSALGDDILRFIAELLTNSDDSYRRIESESGINTETNKIIIRLEKDKRNRFSEEDSYLISVIDNAEGMSKEDLHKKFVTYGGDNAGGVEKHARGIFGQGASDVLRAAAMEKKTASILSFKDGKITKMYYNVDEEDLRPHIELEELKLDVKAIENLREKFNVPNNGTVVSFGIPSTVKFTKKIRENLPDSIEKYPSFRYLLNQENRIVYYEEEGNTPIILSSVNYQFKEENEIYNEDFSFRYEGKEINCNLKLYDNENKKEDGTNIIVIDENESVFDNTMFGHENNPATKNLSGQLLISGFYKLCYDHLNSDNPEAIVRENRTGFETKSNFYKELDKSVLPHLMRVLEASGRKVETTNLGNNRKFNEALKNLNKYLKAELKDEIHGGNIKGVTPPTEGIKFARANATITQGKEYSMKLYINSDMISYNDKISIDCDDDNIEVSPREITYLPSEITDGLVIKNISIKGIECTSDSAKIQARVNNYIANVLIDVIDLEIHYPENGLEFYPNEQSLVYNTEHKLKLYVNTEIIPLKSRIEIIADSLNVDEAVVSVNEESLLDDCIAMIEVKTSGGEIDTSYEVIAKYADIQAVGIITLTEATRNNNTGGGLIAGFKLQANETMDYQAYFNPKDHYIYINTKNPINIKILGELNDLDQENPSFRKEQSKYLCDIISNQAAGLLVKQKNVKNGEINFDDFEEAVEQVQNLIQTQKNIIYNKLYDALV